MINQEFTKNHDGEFAEKCRKALEKAYGVDIPMPKCMVKRANTEKKMRTILRRKNVQRKIT
jgi:hypothetical protein